MPTLDRPGASLHWRDVGRGAPVLLLHAFPLSGDMYRPQIDAFSGRYRLLVPDLRGFGASTLTGAAAPTEMATLAEDALAVLDAASASSAVVLGVSMGGYVAMALLRSHPERVRSIARWAGPRRPRLWISARATGTRPT